MSGKIDDLQDENVELRVETILNPSEDPEKVKKCLVNVVNGCRPVTKDGHVEATCRGIMSLHHMNKQAAYSGVISLAEHYEESPLGPIRVTITSKSLDTIIEWLLLNR